MSKLYTAPNRPRDQKCFLNIFNSVLNRAQHVCVLKWPLRVIYWTIWLFQLFILFRNAFLVETFFLMLNNYCLCVQTARSVALPRFNSISQIKAKAFFDLHNFLQPTCDPYQKENHKIFLVPVSLPSRSLQTGGHFNRKTNIISVFSSASLDLRKQIWPLNITPKIPG